MKKASLFAVALIFAVLLGVGLVLLRSGGGNGDPADVDPMPREVAPRPAGSVGTAPTDIRPKPVGTGDVGIETGRIVKQGKPLDPNDPEGFTDFDVEDAARLALVELGDYEIAAGDELEVAIRFSGPALESLTIVGSYDKVGLQCVADSAQAGPVFRNGIEFYARNEQGRFAVIHQGEPGGKNLDATMDGVTLVRFRMVGLKPGTYRISLPDGQQSFTHALGAEAQYNVTGGTVRVR